MIAHGAHDQEPHRRGIAVTAHRFTCNGSDGKVYGGGPEYPDRVPPAGRIVIDPNLITTGKPTMCTAYVAAGM